MQNVHPFAPSPQLGNTEQKPRVVKIAPGENAKLWNDCLENGYICMGWEAVGDLHQYRDSEEFRAAFAKHYPYNGVKGTVTRKANDVWAFRTLRPGDIVLANKGASEILAVGKVVEPGYQWRPERNECKHTVTVEWDTSFARKIPPQGRWKTTTLSESEAEVELYQSLLRGRGSPPPDSENHFDEIRRALDAANLVYSDEVLSAYLLALQTKRFVILSGISGTGKTQLALAVARKLGSGARTREVTEIPDGAFELVTRPYQLKYNAIVLPKAAQSILRVRDLASGTGTIEVEWPTGRRSLAVRTAGKDGLRIFFSGAFREWFHESLREGDRFYVEVLDDGDDAPHRLRFGIPQKKRALVEEDPRYAVVAVRPDWTDHRGLLGYYNPVLQEYVATDFLRLLLRAQSEEQKAKAEGRKPLPFFAILDEMNLARVEQYFSDFLSAMESGEPIELHDDNAIEAGEGGEELPIPKRLRIPGNLFFTGTVNVDETTYMFSPKVLDRAFVFELNRVDLEGFDGDEAREGEIRIEGLPSPLAVERPPTREDWQVFGTLLDGTLRGALIGLHRILEGHNRHFGYRVASEIARFVVLCVEQSEGEPETTGWPALDWAILSKVLPKLHGTQQELEELLGALFAFAIEPNRNDLDASASRYEAWRVIGDRLEPRDDSLAPARLPRTGAKLHRMAEQLRRRGFTSFIE